MAAVLPILRSSDSAKVRVCVVGAGAAGLCAGRHLASDLVTWEPAIFEQTSQVGGTWVYDERTGTDEFGYPIHSSMYKHLKTNLPYKIMDFPDYRNLLKDDYSSATHQEVLAYLQAYANHFDLYRFIKFNTRVENVRPVVNSDEGHTKWQVRVKNVETHEIQVRDFDVVMVCNGHYFEPSIPAIPGVGSFPGEILHSHSYREPNKFAQKTVVILGASMSGIDIGLELTETARQVYLSHNKEKLTAPLPSNMIQVAGIEKIENNVFTFKDGVTTTADVFMYCTGYLFRFPFLDDSCQIQVDDNYVSPLYKHLVNIEHPTMCIVGIPSSVVPFPLFHMQVKYFLALLQGRVELPSKSDMLVDAALKTPMKRHAHRLANKQWEYNDSLADAGGFERLPAFYRIGYNSWSQERNRNLLNYKNTKFLISEDGQTVQIIPLGDHA
ncbi:flavin-containing monooxygenase FMO GS-OX-like 4 [Orussus abietinus]|uniref:flavin-containing monooxygenase FMO GS-OX-like 4 n=1 Tax=Orussus abietinus TaxID=222816 RepID=UPI00062604D7|nr:flavin-containing monooxygenase FMO GS-OX-like 4 [Orussus abietinus]